MTAFPECVASGLRDVEGLYGRQRHIFGMHAVQTELLESSSVVRDALTRQCMFPFVAQLDRVVTPKV
jgi:hypothetical protein